MDRRIKSGDDGKRLIARSRLDVIRAWRFGTGGAVRRVRLPPKAAKYRRRSWRRSEEHTSELQSLMRSSYAVFCLIKNTTDEGQLLRPEQQKSELTASTATIEDRD